MTEGFLCLFWSLFGPEIIYFGPEILYFGPGVLLSLMESFIRNDRGIFVSFLVPFLVPESCILDPESLFPWGKLYKERQSDFCLFVGPFFGPEILYFGSEILYFGPGIVISLKGSFIKNDRAIFVSFLVPFWSRNHIFWYRNLIFWTRNLNFLEGKLYKECQNDFYIFFGPFLVPKSYIFGYEILYLVMESYILDPESYFPWW